MSSERKALMTDNIDVARLRRFSPFDALRKDGLDDLLEQVEERQASPGEVLFNKGDSDKRSIYLLSGTIELVGDDTIRRAISDRESGKGPKKS